MAFNPDDFSAQPTGGGGFDPNDFNGAVPKKTDQGTKGDLEALIVSAVRGAPESAAFLAGAGAGAAMTKNPIGSFVGGIGGGLMAAILAAKTQGKLEDLVLPKDVKDKLDEFQQEHPKSTLAGRLLTSGFRPGGIEASLKEMAKQRALPAALGGVQQAGMDALANKDQPGLFPEGEVGRVLPAIATGALLNKETGVAKAISGIGRGLATLPATIKANNAAQASSASLIADIQNGMKAGNPEQANAQANELALRGPNEANAGAPPATNAELPLDIPSTGGGGVGRLEGTNSELQGFQPTQLPAPIEHDTGDLTNQLGLDEFGLTKAKKTSKGSDIQKQIEKELGIGRPKGVKESDADYNARILDEVKSRKQIELANQAVDEALGVITPAERPSVDEAPKTRLADILKGESASAQGKPDNPETGPLLDDLLGQKISIKGVNEGKPGTLIKADDGQFQILPDVQKPGQPIRVHDIPDAKGDNIPAKDVGVVPSGLKKDAGFILNPFAEKTPPTQIAYRKNSDGTYEVSTGAARTKEKNGAFKLADLIKNGTYHENLTFDDLRQKFGDVVAGKILGGHGEGFEGGDGKPWHSLEPKTYDFRSRYGAGGGISPALLARLSSPAAGAAIGYQFGDTPEEKRKNAMYGAMLASGAALGSAALSRIAEANPGLFKAIKESMAAKTLTEDQNPVKAKETAITGDLAREVSPPNGFNPDKFDQPKVEPAPPAAEGEAPVTRKPISRGANEAEDTYRARVVDSIGKIQERAQASKSVDVTAKKFLTDLAAQAERAYEPAKYLEGIHNKMLQVEANGRAEVKARQEVVKQDIQDKTDELKAAPGKVIEDIPKFNQIGVRLSPIEKIKVGAMDSLKSVRNGFNAIGQHTANRDTVFNMMDGYQKFRGALNTIFGGTLDTAYSYEQNLKSDWKDDIQKTIDRGKWAKVLGFGVIDPKSMERINIYAHDRMNKANPDLPNSHLEDSGITPERIQHIIDTITPEELAFYNKAREVLDTKSGPTVREAMHKDFNIDVGQIKDYWPTQVIRRKTLMRKALGQPVAGEQGHEAAIDDLIGSLKQDFTGRPSSKVNEGITVEKQKGAKGEINLSENLIDRHLDQAAHLVSHAAEVQKLGKIARQKWFAEKYGDKGQKYTLELLDSVARDSDPAGSKRIPILDGIAKNYAVAILGLRVFSQLKHISNIAYGVNEVGAAGLAHGMVDNYTPLGREFLKKHAPEAYQRSGGETAIHELLEGGRLRKAQAHVFIAERIVDRAIAGATTLGAYKNELERMGIDTSNYLTDPVNRKAMNQALITARKVVTSSLRKDSPQAVSRGKLTGGSMTLSRMALQFQQTALRQIHYAGTELVSEGLAKGDVAHAAKALAAIIGALAIETSLVETNKHLLGGKNKNSKESTPQEEMALEALRKVPGFANVQAATGHGDTGIPTVDVTTKGLHAVGQLYTGKNDFGTKMGSSQKKKAEIDAATFAGSLLGIPGVTTIGQAKTNAIPRLPK